ncbi:CBS domain-containing protein [Klenkia soli]|uniref:CBS domain-containing protein n=1 Tax=Klenkia soli TaxID=1052260 RepID=A0A1H0JB06_9ACTN|nr:CBS domain-containing protein [Klenkia soli]SDO40856.1 CBS domain-containing protein [Klenkia soli]
MEGPCRGTTTRGTTVRRALLAHPRTSPPGTSVAQAWAFFADDHVHALLVVDGDRLLAVVERDDLVGAAPTAPVELLGRLGDRTVDPAADLGRTHDRLLAEGRRRLAVVDGDGVLLGLLCLKRSGRGFCSDADVRARAAERLALAG